MRKVRKRQKNAKDFLNFFVFLAAISVFFRIEKLDDGLQLFRKKFSTSCFFPPCRIILYRPLDRKPPITTSQPCTQ